MPTHNVRLGYWFSALETASMSARAGDVLSIYVLLITNQRADVLGLIQGANGMLQLAAAMPAGWLADKLSRARVLMIASIIGTLAGICMAWALFTNQEVMWVALGMATLGIYKGIYNPPMEAIFADSVETGRKRDQAYTTRYIIQNLSNCFGPIQSLIMFAILGNTWTVKDCRTVLRVGIALLTAPLLLLHFFDDKKSLGVRSESLRAQSCNSSRASLAETDPEVSNEGVKVPWYRDSSIMVPAVITTSDLFAALASGMATKFYTVFFVQLCGMSPVFSSIVAILGPVCVSSFSALVNFLGTYCDRFQIVLVTKALDFLMLMAMALMPTGEANLFWLVTIHLLRSGVANCSRPQLRSMLMDYVDKKHRAKWSAVDSFRTVSWSGSAALGGVLIEHYGFQATFMISALMKMAGWLALLALLPLIGKGCGRPLRAQEEGPEQAQYVVGRATDDQGAAESTQHETDGNSDSLSAPLLQPR